MPKSLQSSSPKADDKFSRFIETARKLGCDEDKDRFEKSLGKIAAYKPPKKPSKMSSKRAAVRK